MSVLAVIQNDDQIQHVLPLALRFCDARSDDGLKIIYFGELSEPSETDEDTVESNSDTEQSIQVYLDEINGRFDQDLANAEIHRIESANQHSSTVEYIRTNKIDLLVCMTIQSAEQLTITDPGRALLRNSPCDTVLLCRSSVRLPSPKRVFVGTAENSVSDQLSIALTADFCVKEKIKCNVVKFETDPGSNAVEVGRRDLTNLLKSTGVKKTDLIKTKVLVQSQESELLKLANQTDIVFVSANSHLLFERLATGTRRPAIAMIKKAPPLRDWRSFWLSSFLSPLNPASYGDLIHGLRRDSKISEDFLVMLGLSASIASVGLLQDSAAVVIGSMILAPLMTPMIGCGLATAQANPSLGRTSLKTIAVGFVLTLVISYVIGHITPGNELTPQILARGVPNILDLIVALFSGAAAAFALARPNIVGAVAGVAIATALVPPLCSAGISLSYLEYKNALGAGILFVVNVVAIILSAALTFRMLGVTAVRVTRWQRQWVLRLLAVLCLILLALAYPLLQSLQQELIKGRPIPNLYPLSRAVLDAVVIETEKRPGVQLIASGRPASGHDNADVVLFLSAPHDVDPNLRRILEKVVRQTLNDENLVIEVHCLRNAWPDD